MRISSAPSTGNQPTCGAYACDITQIMMVIKMSSFAGALWDVLATVLQSQVMGAAGGVLPGEGTVFVY